MDDTSGDDLLWDLILTGPLSDKIIQAVEKDPVTVANVSVSPITRGRLVILSNPYKDLRTRIQLSRDNASDLMRDVPHTDNVLVICLMVGDKLKYLRTTLEVIRNTARPCDIVDLPEDKKNQILVWLLDPPKLSTTTYLGGDGFCVMLKRTLSDGKHSGIIDYDSPLKKWSLTFPIPSGIIPKNDLSGIYVL